MKQMQLSKEAWSVRSEALFSRLAGTPVEGIAKYLQICSNMHVSQGLKGHSEREYWQYPSPEAIVLSLGVAMEAGPYPKRLPRGTPRACFANSLELACRYPKRFTYCEGWALPGFLPKIGVLAIQHAWVIDQKTHRVVDPTWDEGEEISVYLGLPFKRAWAEAALGKSGSVLFDYARDHPLMSQEMPITRWMAEVATNPIEAETASLSPSGA